MPDNEQSKRFDDFYRGVIEDPWEGWEDPRGITDSSSQITIALATCQKEKS